MNRTVILALSGLLLAALARADDVPPSQYLVDGVDQGAPGSFPILVGNGGSVTLTASPNASVQLIADGSPDFTLNTPSADLVYFFEYVGPDGSVPLLLSTALGVSFVEPEGGSGNDTPHASAGIEVRPTDGGADVIEKDVSVFFFTDSDSFTGLLSASILTNTIYQIDLTASASTLGAEHAVASVDPQLSLDGNLVDPSLYTLVLSDGIGNAGPTGPTATPEPSYFVMLSLAAAGCVFVYRRFRS